MVKKDINMKCLQTVYTTNLTTVILYYNSDTLLPLEKESRTRGNSQKLKKQSFKTTIRRQFFSLRVTNYWNGLPDDIITSASLNIFKNKIDKLYGDSKYSMEFPIIPISVSHATV